MSKTTNRRLNLIEATRILYHTDAPTDEQIGRVYGRMKSGAIRVDDDRGEPHDWITTEKSLADFVAVEMARRQKQPGQHFDQRREPRSSPKLVAKRQSLDAKSLKDVYHSIWRDAFLAILLRRRMAHRSVKFHRTILICQIVLLVTLVGTILSVTGFVTRRIAPERAAIASWIESQTDTYQVTQWHPPKTLPDGSGVVVEVEYRYTKDSRRPVNTRRTFQVVGDEVSEVLDE